MTPEKKMSIAHNLTVDDLSRLQTLLEAHNIGEFWRVLGTEYHDTYADNAYAVITHPATPMGEFFGTLVKRHWENTNPNTPNAYQDSFAAVGLTHATNYLNILKNSENWPDTQQIEQSYRAAVEQNGLTPQTAFDGVWANGVLQSVLGVHWAITLGMETGRIVESDVFTDLQNDVPSNKTLAVDFIETLISDAKYTFLPDILAQSSTDLAVGDFGAIFNDQPPLYKVLFIVESFLQSMNQVNGNVVGGLFDFITDFLPNLGGNLLDFLNPAYGDGVNLSANDHQLVFGFENADSIKGSDGKDHLYGMGGNDIISGNDGSDYMEGNSGNDSLSGGEGDDTLDGGKGNDSLDGGGGNDILKGGEGYDRYFANNGDAIDDTDGYGKVYFDDKPLNGGTKKAGETDWKDAAGHTYTMLGGKLFVKDGDSLIVIENFLNHRLGIHLIDATPRSPVTSLNLTGDLALLDIDLATDGLQLGYDDLDNWLRNPDQQNPNYYDTLSGSGGSDWIQGFGGSDKLQGQGSDDVLEGGADSDILSGGAGDDVLYADSKADLATVYESDTVPSGSTRDWLAGSDGDEQLFGSAGSDGLSGDNRISYLIG